MAKHWKQFLKEEERDTSKSGEIQNAPSIAGILKSKEGKDVLGGIAASNTNLKALLEEQEKLEEKMNALTGKTEEHLNEEKKYKSEIKTIHQKRKEEFQRENKKTALNKKRKEKLAEANTWSKKEKEKFNIGIRKQAKVDDFKRFQKKLKNTIETTKKQVRKTEESAINLPLKKKKIIKNVGDDYSLHSKLKEATQFNVVTELKKQTKKEESPFSIKKVAKRKEKKPVEKVKKVGRKVKKKSKDVLKTYNKLDKAFSKGLNVAKKASNTGNDVLQTLNKLDKKLDTKDGKLQGVLGTVKKISKTSNDVFKVFKEIDSTRKKVNEGIKEGRKKEANFNTKIAKIKTKKEAINHLDESLNKVNNFFDKTKGYLEKTDKTTTHFESALEKVNPIKKKERKQENSFSMNSLHKIFTNEEEGNRGFKMNKKSLSSPFSGIKKVKKKVDELGVKKNSKTKKDRFSI